MCAFELFKEFGTSGEHDASADKFYNLAGIIIPVVGALGRILWGILGDKVSYKILFVVGNVLSVILQVGLLIFCSQSSLNSIAKVHVATTKIFHVRDYQVS